MTAFAFILCVFQAQAWALSPQSIDRIALEISPVMPGNPQTAMHEEAVKRVRKHYEKDGKVFYEHQRVELTGVNSADDTEVIQPKMFDVKEKLSFKNDKSSSDSPPSHGIKGWTKNLLRDLWSADNDLEGNGSSKRAKDVIAKLEGKEIKELYAHSWAVEAVYKGILQKRILSPKRLVLIGVPETEFGKWELLSRTTGTEVIFVTSTRDVVNGAKDMVEGTKSAMASRAEPGMDKRSDLMKKLDRAGLEGDWEDWCITSASDRGCPAYGRKGDFSHIDLKLKDAGVLGHDRAAYYRALNKLKYHGQAILSKTWEELGAEQKASIDRVEADLLRQAEEKAQGLVAEADRIKANIESRQNPTPPPSEAPALDEDGIPPHIDYPAAKAYIPPAIPAQPAVPAYRLANGCDAATLAAWFEEIAVQACSDPSNPPQIPIARIPTCKQTERFNDGYRPANSDPCVQNFFVLLRDTKQSGDDYLITPAWVTMHAIQIRESLRPPQPPSDTESYPNPKPKTCRHGVWNKEEYDCP